MGTVRAGALEGRQGHVIKREQRSTIADEILADSGYVCMYYYTPFHTPLHISQTIIPHHPVPGIFFFLIFKILNLFNSILHQSLRAYRKRKMLEIQGAGRQGKKRHIAQKKAKRQPKWFKFASGVPQGLS